MRNDRKVTALSVIAACALSACNVAGATSDSGGDTGGGAVGTPAGGSGNATVRSYALSDFTGVTLAGSDDVVITRGDRFAVTATGPAATLDRLELRVRGSILEIKRRDGMGWTNDDGATVRVTMPALTRLEIAGSGDATADTLTGADAGITIAGSGRAAVSNIAVSALDLSIGGSGDIIASGQATSVDASIGGSGDIEAADLNSTRADLATAGSGSINLSVSETAAISMAGSGDVTVSGGARCTTSRVGSGTVACR
jgi:hypothetical protein